MRAGSQLPGHSPLQAGPHHGGNAAFPAPRPTLTSMLLTVRAQPTTFSPCWTRARATAAPMPDEAPVTKASRPRHRSMPTLATACPPISEREKCSGAEELRPGSQRPGLSLVTVAGATGARARSAPRPDPPPFGSCSGIDSTPGSSALRAREHAQLAALALARQAPSGTPLSGKKVPGGCGPLSSLPRAL